MKQTTGDVSRRSFLTGSAAGFAVCSIVPRHVLGQGQIPPSEELRGALIGCGLTFVMDSDEWGDRYNRRSGCDVRLEDLSQKDQKIIDDMPDPEPLIDFAEAVKRRKQPGGHAEAAHRTATLMHLANIAIRTGRKIQYDPESEQILGDEEANRLVSQPMRAPWRV